MSVIKTKDVIAFIKNNEKIGIEMLPALYDIFDNLIDENESLRQEVAKYKQLAEESQSARDKIATLGKGVTSEIESLRQEVAKYKQLAEESQSDRDKIATFVTDVWVPSINRAALDASLKYQGDQGDKGNDSDSDDTSDN